MGITLRKYTQSDEKVWDEFVFSSSNGTIFQLRAFLSYHIDRQFKDHSLIFENRGNIITVFPAAKITENNKTILYSHPGASFGGFVFLKMPYSDTDDIINTFTIFLDRGYDGKVVVLKGSVEERLKTIKSTLAEHNIDIKI